MAHHHIERYVAGPSGTWPDVVFYDPRTEMFTYQYVTVHKSHKDVAQLVRDGYWKLLDSAMDLPEGF